MTSGERAASMSDRGATLAGLADALIPATREMPASSSVGVAGKWLDRVLAVRPDLLGPLDAVLSWATGREPYEAVRELHRERPQDFAVLARIVTAAYYMDPKVRRLIGYPGQTQNEIYPDEAEYYLRDGLLDPVLRRHGRRAIWPPTPADGPAESPYAAAPGTFKVVGRPRERDGADVVIVGAGASGAIAARHLAAAGAAVVCLEQGDWINTSDYPGDKREWELLAEAQWSANPNVRGLREDYPCEVSEADITPVMHNAVGGSTIHYAAQWARMRPSDFRVRSTDGVGDDWPLSYEEMVPYYEQVDGEMGVSGLGGDPMYPESAPPPLPPLPIGALGRKAAEGMNRMGWHWWPASHAIPSRKYGRLSACVRRGTCTTGCPEGAKGSTDRTHWPAAIGDGARLITRARAREITIDEQGRANGVVYIDRDGKEHLQRASSVILAANGVGTARLLLLSASRRFPDGLANSSGLVGKRLMMHPYMSVLGLYEDELRSWQGPAGTPILSLEFGDTDASRGFARGAQWDSLTTRGPFRLLDFFDDLPFEQRWGDSAHQLMKRAFGRSFHWGIGIEDLPSEANSVTLDPHLVDSDGIPAPRISYRIDPDARANLAFQCARAREAHEAGGALETIEIDWSAWGWHLLGTARMGIDPTNSVVDPYGRSHDVPNLFVFDGSAFVTSGPMAPTATIAANALRCTEHLIKTARSIRKPD